MPIPRYKVLIVQTDSQELDFRSELGLDAGNVFFSATLDVNTDNVQQAIEIAGSNAQSALDTPIFPIILTHNGTVGGGTFLGYSSLIPGDDTPIVVGRDADLVNFTFSNGNANADYSLIFRKNSTVASPFLTVSKTNEQFFSFDLITPESFLAGDRIYIEYQDDGTNASDVGMVLNFRAEPI